MKGQVVGVNTSGFSSAIEKPLTTKPRLDIVQGMFYARNARTAELFANMLIHNKQINRASLGLKKIESFWHPISYERNGPKRGFQDAGVMVLEFDKDSVAKSAGMTEGDLIVGMVKADGLSDIPGEIRTVGDLYNALAFVKPGETVEVTYRRFLPDDIRNYVQGSPLPPRRLRQFGWSARTTMTPRDYWNIKVPPP
jgi:S1-C subfamily serine protease